MSDMKCPHGRIQHCPLYVASHESHGPGCIDSESDEQNHRTGLWGACVVERGKKDYGQLIAALAKVKPHIIAQCANAENLAASRQQRQRNLKAAGLN